MKVGSVLECRAVVNISSDVTMQLNAVKCNASSSHAGSAADGVLVTALVLVTLVSAEPPVPADSYLPTGTGHHNDPAVYGPPGYEAGTPYSSYGAPTSHDSYSDHKHAGYPDKHTGYPDKHTGYPDKHTGYPDKHTGYPDKHEGYSDNKHGSYPHKHEDAFAHANAGGFPGNQGSGSFASASAAASSSSGNNNNNNNNNNFNNNNNNNNSNNNNSSSNDEDSTEDPLSEPARYEFAYEVNDPPSGQSFGHSEQRDGDFTQGAYFVELPDGRLQKVSYTADKNGYRAEVTYEDSKLGSNDANQDNSNNRASRSNNNDNSNNRASRSNNNSSQNSNNRASQPNNDDNNRSSRSNNNNGASRPNNINNRRQPESKKSWLDF